MEENSAQSPGRRRQADEFNVVLPQGVSTEPNFWDSIRNKGVEVDAEPREPSYAQQTIFWLIGSAALIFFLIYMMRRNVDPLGGGMMGNFIRSQAKRFQPSDQRTTFQDVAALEQAKLELQEIVEFLGCRTSLSGWGGRCPRACCWSDRPAPGKRFWPRRSPVRPACLFSD